MCYCNLIIEKSLSTLNMIRACRRHVRERGSVAILVTDVNRHMGVSRGEKHRGTWWSHDPYPWL